MSSPQTDSGRLAMVTGGTRGIGLAATRNLLKMGFNVWITGRTPIGADMLPEDSTRVFRCDFSDRESVAGLLDRLREARRKIDVLVNNAATVSNRIDEGTGLAEGFLVNAYAPVALTDGLCRQGLVGTVVNVLAGTEAPCGEESKARTLTGLIGYFSNKQLMMHAQAHIAKLYGTGCLFFRPLGTKTSLQDAAVESLPISRFRAIKNVLMWINACSLATPDQSAGPLAEVCQRHHELPQFSVVHARVKAQPTLATLTDERLTKRAYELVLGLT